MTQTSTQAMAIMLARSPEWQCLFNDKYFDKDNTAVLRVYRNDLSGKITYAAFGMTSKDGEMVKECVEVNAEKGAAVKAAAAYCDLPDDISVRAMEA